MMSGIREFPREPEGAMDFVLWMALSQAPQSFANLWPTATRAGGKPPPDDTGYRFTDRWLQAGRRKGWLTFERSGRTPIWSLTDAGRAEFARKLADATTKDKKGAADV